MNTLYIIFILNQLMFISYGSSVILWWLYVECEQALERDHKTFDSDTSFIGESQCNDKLSSNSLNKPHTIRLEKCTNYKWCISNQSARWPIYCFRRLWYLLLIFKRKRFKTKINYKNQFEIQWNKRKTTLTGVKPLIVSGLNGITWTIVIV